MSGFDKADFMATVTAGAEYVISLPAFQEVVLAGGIDAVTTGMV